MTRCARDKGWLHHACGVRCVLVCLESAEARPRGIVKPVPRRRDQCVHGGMVCRAIKERNAIKTLILVEILPCHSHQYPPPLQPNLPD